MMQREMLAGDERSRKGGCYRSTEEEIVAPRPS